MASEKFRLTELAGLSWSKTRMPDGKLGYTAQDGIWSSNTFDSLESVCEMVSYEIGEEITPQDIEDDIPDPE